MVFEERFDDNINFVVEYMNNFEEEPRKNEIYKGIYISRFIHKIRCIYNKGKKLEDGSIMYKDDILKKEQIELLIKNNFDFNIKSDFEMFKYKAYLLEEYLQENSWNSIKENTIYKNLDIGRWVNYIRNIYNNGKKLEDGSIVYKKKKLSKEKIDYLNKKRFIWNKNEVEYISKEDFNAKKRYLLISFKELLNNSKNEIKTKKDIDKINKMFIKKLD